jgi:hypothetical protein
MFKFCLSLFWLSSNALKLHSNANKATAKFDISGREYYGPNSFGDDLQIFCLYHF